MRLLQLPLWLAVSVGLAVFFGSIDKDFAAALIFASIFGLVYGGGMSMLKRPSQLGLKKAPRYDSALRAPRRHVRR
ncbi:MAG: hypothetical protein AAF221_12895 [Pseudomonadota bacterium]